MENETSTASYFALKRDLEQSLSESTTCKEELLLHYAERFLLLDGKLKAITESISANDVLKTHKVPKEFDEIVDEYKNRAICAELLLAFENLPTNLVEKFNQILPAVKEEADLQKKIVAAQKRMLQILNQAGVSKPKSSSGCMGVILILILFTSILFIAA